jgi:hypothetical protein
MTLTDTTKDHVISTYVTPARMNGEKTIRVRVGNVAKELGWTNRTPSVFSTLSSQAFQREAGLELIEKRGGPPSGGPSTTVQFVYKVLEKENTALREKENVKPNGAGLEALYGILSDTYRRLGGAEAFMQAEREWGPDPWEKLALENQARSEKT